MKKIFDSSVVYSMEKKNTDLISDKDFPAWWENFIKTDDFDCAFHDTLDLVFNHGCEGVASYPITEYFYSVVKAQLDEIDSMRLLPDDEWDEEKDEQLTAEIIDILRELLITDLKVALQFVRQIDYRSEITTFHFE